MSKALFPTPKDVDAEIERLRGSVAVKIAKKEMSRRQYMYGLRNLEKRGLALMKQGYTLDSIKEVDG